MSFGEKEKDEGQETGKRHKKKYYAEPGKKMDPKEILLLVAVVAVLFVIGAKYGI